MWFRFKDTRQPQPGTGSLAFQRVTVDPSYQVSGRGIGVIWDWYPTQPTQQYYNMAVANAGVPVIAGQMFGQPLLNPNGF